MPATNRPSALPALPASVAILASLLALQVPLAARANPALMQALEAGDLQTLQQLLDSGEALDLMLPDGSTALHWAVLHEQAPMVERLLQSGATAGIANRNGVTPLHLAAMNGSVATTALLLAAGADANATLPSGESVLMVASRTGSIGVVEQLLGAGALVDQRDPGYQQTALMIASRENHPAVVRLLLRHGAQVNARTRLGPMLVHIPPCKGTGCGSEGVGINRSGVPDRGERHEQKGGFGALLYAAREGHAEVAQALLAAGADMETTEANGITPLLMAVLNNQLDLAYLLLERGARVNVEDFWGRTPLFAAVDYRNLDLNSANEDSPVTNHVDREPILGLISDLLQAGANVNARTREWHPEKKWLYALNDVSWVDVTGQTPFVRAAQAGDVSVMRLLLEHGADPHLATYAGTTALMAAAGVNWTVAQTYTESAAASLAAVTLCLELGLDINAANSMGLTALLGASNRGFNDMIRLLAASGAQLDVKDTAGRSALTWAEGVFLAAVGAQQKPDTLALLKQLLTDAGLPHE
jgi:ankyrin repeat protein